MTKADTLRKVRMDQLKESLTTDVKITIYEEIRDKMINGDADGYSLCVALKYATIRHYCDVHGNLNAYELSYTEVVKELFPMLYAYKGANDEEQLWWPQEDKEVRILVLNNIINKLKKSL